MERDRRFEILGVLVLAISILTLFIIIHAIRVQGDDFIALTKSDEGRIKKELGSVNYLEMAGLSLEVRCLSIPADQVLGIDKRSLSQMFTL